MDTSLPRVYAMCLAAGGFPVPGIEPGAQAAFMEESMRAAVELLDTEGLPAAAAEVMRGRGKASGTAFAAVPAEQDETARCMGAILLKRVVDVQHATMAPEMVRGIAEAAWACVASPEEPSDVRRQAAVVVSTLARRVGPLRGVGVLERMVSALRSAAAGVVAGDPAALPSLTGVLAAAEMLCEDAAEHLDVAGPSEAHARAAAASDALVDSLLGCAGHPSSRVHLPATRALAHLCAVVPRPLAVRIPRLVGALGKLAAATTLSGGGGAAAAAGPAAADDDAARASAVCSCLASLAETAADGIVEELPGLVRWSAGVVGRAAREAAAGGGPSSAWAIAGLDAMALWLSVVDGAAYRDAAFAAAAAEAVRAAGPALVACLLLPGPAAAAVEAVMRCEAEAGAAYGSAAGLRGAGASASASDGLCEEEDDDEMEAYAEAAGAEPRAGGVTSSWSPWSPPGRADHDALARLLGTDGGGAARAEAAAEAASEGLRPQAAVVLQAVARGVGAGPVLEACLPPIAALLGGALPPSAGPGPAWRAVEAGAVAAGCVADALAPLPVAADGSSVRPAAGVMAPLDGLRRGLVALASRPGREAAVRSSAAWALGRVTRAWGGAVRATADAAAQLHTQAAIAEARGDREGAARAAGAAAAARGARDGLASAVLTAASEGAAACLAASAEPGDGGGPVPSTLQRAGNGAAATCVEAAAVVCAVLAAAGSCGPAATASKRATAASALRAAVASLPAARPSVMPTALLVLGASCRALGRDAVADGVPGLAGELASAAAALCGAWDATASAAGTVAAALADPVSRSVLSALASVCDAGGGTPALAPGASSVAGRAASVVRQALTEDDDVRRRTGEGSHDAAAAAAVALRCLASLCGGAPTSAAGPGAARPPADRGACGAAVNDAAGLELAWQCLRSPRSQDVHVEACMLVGALLAAHPACASASRDGLRDLLLAALGSPLFLVRANAAVAAGTLAAAAPPVAAVLAPVLVGPLLAGMDAAAPVVTAECGAALAALSAVNPAPLVAAASAHPLPAARALATAVTSSMSVQACATATETLLAALRSAPGMAAAPGVPEALLSSLSRIGPNVAAPLAGGSEAPAAIRAAAGRVRAAAAAVVAGLSGGMGADAWRAEVGRMPGPMRAGLAMTVGGEAAARAGVTA